MGKVRAKKARTPPPATPVETCRAAWDSACAAMHEAQTRVYSLRERLAAAEVAALDAERRLAAAGLAAYRAGHDQYGGWLVAWWNNLPTSPRGDGPCVTLASEIPAAAKPI